MELLDLVHDILDLQSAQSVLGWDQDTHMPAKGAEGRARALGTLERELHRKMIDPRLGDLARQAESSDDPIMRDIGKSWRESHEDALQVPESLLSSLVEQASLGSSVWHDATTFEEVLPYLDSLVKLNRQYAACYPDWKPYDVLIDCFDWGLSQDFIDRAFTVLKPGLLDLRSKAPAVEPAMDFRASSSDLIRLCKQMTSWMGYDYEAGNLSETEHPFMIRFNSRDVRIAINIKEQDPLFTLTEAVHEAGHALYEQNAGYADTGLDSLDSAALHESQSLFWEVMIGKSPTFWNRWIEEFRKACHCDVSVPEIIGQLRRYDPTNLIRLRAGDLDYGLHILIRYEVERDLFVNGMEAVDMRDRFNDLCQEYFGRRPREDRREGVLQDCHWPSGYFGYFPSYLLGVSFSAQLAKMCPASNNPAEILSFLKENVHQHAGRYTFEELTDKLGGYDPRPYLSYLASAYNIG